MRKSRTTSQPWIPILLAAGALSFGAPTARAGFPIDPDPEKGKAAILSLMNHTGEPSATGTILSLIREEIEARGIHCVPDSVLKPVLRSHRIRTGDLGVGIDQAREIEQDTGATDLIFGSIDIWSGGEDPEVGLSLRIVRARDMRIVGAASASATGEELAKLFGFGRVRKVEDLAPRVVRRAFEDLDDLPALDVTGQSRREQPRVALLTFDNLSAEPHGGEIVTSILLSRMVQAGFDVLEPGVMNSIFVRDGQIPRGEIDYALMQGLAEAAGSRIIVTGVVQDLAAAGGPEGTPRFEFGARGIDARAGRVVFTIDRAENGRVRETILQLGRIRSLTGLVEHSVGPVIEAVVKAQENAAAATETRVATGNDTGTVGTGWKQR